MRLLLLLTVAALSHVTQGEEDISGCAFDFKLGKKYTSIFPTAGEDTSYVCFDKEHSPTSAADVCVEFSGVPLDQAAVTVEETAPCNVEILFSKDAVSKVKLVLNTDGTLTATSLVPDEVTMKLYITTESYRVQSTLQENVPVTRNPSGCIDNGLRYSSGAAFCDINMLLVCTPEDALESSECFTCTGGACSVGKVCAVTGSSVIDFSFEKTDIEDRCGYTLLEAGDVKVEAAFAERRRTDVSLLEHLLITIGDKKIQMKPGQVKLDDTVLNLDEAMPAEMPSGVTASKTPTGLSLLYSGKFNLELDGYSAVIAVTGIEFSDVGGLCKSGPLDSKKSTELSPQGCDTDETQDPDGTIDCDAAKAHCDLLNDEIFSSCHPLVAHQGYVTACKDTLCTYPSVDGIDCSFIQAYATACENVGATVSGWEDLTSCDSTHCGSTYCSENEFCGVHLSEERCFCRALFAAKYPTSLGDTTVCSSNSASLTLYTCLLAEKGVHYDELQLLDPTCKGELDEEEHTLNFAFDSANICGTTITSDNSMVTFENKVVLQDHSNDMVTRHDQFEVKFSCAYSQPEVKTVALKIKDSSVVQDITAGDWSFTLNLKVYLDSARTTAVADDTELQLDQKVWVELSTTDLDENLVSIVTKSCWATSEDDKDATTKYELVVAGCPNAADSSVNVNGNGVGTSNYFSFNMFQFTGQSTDVYLHCEVTLCVEDDCTPDCSGGDRRRRRRRALFREPSPAFISMSWAR